MSNEIQKNARIEKRIRFVLLLFVLAGVSLLFTGLRGVTKDLPTPEDKFAPKLTPAPRLQIHGVNPQQSAEEKEPFSFYVNGKKIEGTIVPIEKTENAAQSNEKRSGSDSRAASAPGSRAGSGNKPSQESHFEDSVSTVESSR